MAKVEIFLLDNSNITIEEKAIIKPKTYHALLIKLKKNIKHLPEFYEIFVLIDNKEIKITNEDNYKLTENILFIREINKDN